MAEENKTDAPAAGKADKPATTQPGAAQKTTVEKIQDSIVSVIGEGNVQSGKDLYKKAKEKAIAAGVGAKEFTKESWDKAVDALSKNENTKGIVAKSQTLFDDVNANFKKFDDDTGNVVSNNMWGMIAGVGALLIGAMMGLDPIILLLLALVAAVAGSFLGDGKNGFMGGLFGGEKPRDNSGHGQGVEPSQGKGKDGKELDDPLKMSAALYDKIEADVSKKFNEDGKLSNEEQAGLAFLKATKEVQQNAAKELMDAPNKLSEADREKLAAKDASVLQPAADKYIATLQAQMGKLSAEFAKDGYTPEETRVLKTISDTSREDITELLRRNGIDEKEIVPTLKTYGLDLPAAVDKAAAGTDVKPPAAGADKPAAGAEVKPATIAVASNRLPSSEVPDGTTVSPGSVPRAGSTPASKVSEDSQIDRGTVRIGENQATFTIDKNGKLLTDDAKNDPNSLARAMKIHGALAGNQFVITDIAMANEQGNFEQKDGKIVFQKVPTTDKRLNVIDQGVDLNQVNVQSVLNGLRDVEMVRQREVAERIRIAEQTKKSTAYVERRESLRIQPEFKTSQTDDAVDPNKKHVTITYATVVDNKIEERQMKGILTLTALPENQILGATYNGKPTKSGRLTITSAAPVVGGKVQDFTPMNVAIEKIPLRFDASNNIVLATNEILNHIKVGAPTGRQNAGATSTFTYEKLPGDKHPIIATLDGIVSQSHTTDPTVASQLVGAQPRRGEPAVTVP